jgi:hypothetical protein
VNQPAGRGLVPPRPNLGPESWSDARPSPVAGIVAVAALGGLLIAWLLWSWRKKMRARIRRDHKTQSPNDATPQGRLVAFSSSIRQTLADRFGTAWRAKTTQELATEDLLVEMLGYEQLDELIRFLDFVDHLKFAPERSSNNHEALESELTNWEPRIAAIGKTIEAKPDRRQKPATAYARPQNSTPTVSRAEIAGASSK